MNIGLATMIALIVAMPVLADEQTIIDRWNEDRTQVFEAGEITIPELQWQARALVIFADTPNDPRFRQQMDLLIAGVDDLAERDVIIITDTDPSVLSPLRRVLRPRGYMLALLAKDGRVAQRKPEAVTVRELSRSIDKMPLRQQEVFDRRFIEQ
ncbi:DUF4174 domain-containing protein [Yoonia sp.]|uniref:DUF4174 domain-containing protein n=1 Tax=Yoonia sp. TaxID=2212373 RepID=UPI0025FE7FE4|nr:DUF4174 domain-containing protein [Yoonia sp.]